MSKADELWGKMSPTDGIEKVSWRKWKRLWNRIWGTSDEVVEQTKKQNKKNKNKKNTNTKPKNDAPETKPETTKPETKPTETGPDPRDPDYFSGGADDYIQPGGNQGSKITEIKDKVVETAGNIKDKAKDVAWKAAGPTTALLTSYGLMTLSHNQKQKALEEIENKVSANKLTYSLNDKDLKLHANDAFADSLMTNTQLKALNEIKDVNERNAVRDGFDNFNLVEWEQSHPSIAHLFNKQDYRKNLYDAGKLKPWTDKDSEFYDESMVVPGYNYTYPETKTKK